MKRALIALLITLMLVWALPIYAGCAEDDSPFILDEGTHYCADYDNEMIIGFKYANWTHDYLENTPVMLYQPENTEKYPNTNISIFRMQLNPQVQNHQALEDFYEENMLPPYQAMFVELEEYLPVQRFEVEGEAAVLYTLIGRESEEAPALVGQIYLFFSHNGIVQLTSYAQEQNAEAMAEITKSMIDSYAYNAPKE